MQDQLVIHLSRSANRNSSSESVWPLSLSLSNTITFFDFAILLTKLFLLVFWSGILSYECHQSSMLESGLKFFIESLTVLSANKSFKMLLPSERCLIIYLDELKNRKIFFLASHWTLRLWKVTGVMLKYLTIWMS